MSLMCKWPVQKGQGYRNHVDICVAKDLLIFWSVSLKRGAQLWFFFYVKFSHGACLYVLVLQNAIEIASIVSCQRYVHCVLAFQKKWPLPNSKQNQAKNVWDFKIRQVLNLLLLSYFVLQIVMAQKICSKFYKFQTINCSAGISLIHVHIICR